LIVFYLVLSLSLLTPTIGPHTLPQTEGGHNIT
jgi:hypothetical protein